MAESYGLSMVRLVVRVMDVRRMTRGEGDEASLKRGSDEPTRGRRQLDLVETTEPGELLCLTGLGQREADPVTPMALPT